MRHLIAACIATLLVVSCSQAAETVPADAQVVVTLKDTSIGVSVPSIKAGTIKFAVQNSGSMAHEFELLKTDLAPDKLPVDGGSAKAKEDGLVKQIQNIGVGKVATVSADLAAGHYVIICNVPGHYQLGMRTELRVE